MKTSFVWIHRKPGT